MKKILLLLMLSLLCASSFAFGIREHCAIAAIAEKYLTPKAAKAVHEILGGEKMATYATYPDVCRKTLFRDSLEVPHTFPIAKDRSCLNLQKRGAVRTLLESIEELKDWKNLDEQRRFEDLVLVIHLVGDTHCPSHISEPKVSSQARPSHYVYQKDTVNFHKAWDTMFIAKSFSGGHAELADLADVATPRQRREFQKGSPEDWALENVRESMDYTHDLDVSQSRVVVVDRPYVFEHALYAKRQVMKAGYRLAKVLNELFR